ncbi:MAG: hypothetical protein AB1508_11590 [Pseudomonadota bacterium]
MAARVIQFRNPATPIAQFIRVGEAHKKFGELHAAGRLPAKRVVIEGSRLLIQKDLIAALKRDGIEIVLDPQTAELAARGRFSGAVRHAPWATAAVGQPLGPEHFVANARTDVIGQIARFAVAQGVDTVLAPTHFLADPDYNEWLRVDRDACVTLRRALDREGGANIAIDYPVIHSHVAIHEAAVRSEVIDALMDLPYDNLWLRMSGLGHEARPQTTRQFILSLQSMHNLGCPIVIDHLDGLLGQAVLAFGGASGLAHGIMERNQFDARSWHKDPRPKDEDGDFGRTTYVPIPVLGRALKRNELELLSAARGGKRAVGCQDICCADGVANMIADTRQHAARQAFAAVEVFAPIPDHNREQFFLEKPLRETERVARTVKDLKPPPKEAERLGIGQEAMVNLFKRLTEHHGRIVKLGDTLALMHEARGKGAPRAKSAAGPRHSLNTHNIEEKR